MIPIKVSRYDILMPTRVRLAANTEGIVTLVFEISKEHSYTTGLDKDTSIAVWEAYYKCLNTKKRIFDLTTFSTFKLET